MYAQVINQNQTSQSAYQVFLVVSHELDSILLRTKLWWKSAQVLELQTLLRALHQYRVNKG